MSTAKIITKIQISKKILKAIASDQRLIADIAILLGVEFITVQRYLKPSHVFHSRLTEANVIAKIEIALNVPREQILTKAK